MFRTVWYLVTLAAILSPFIGTTPTSLGLLAQARPGSESPGPARPESSTDAPPPPEAQTPDLQETKDQEGKSDTSHTEDVTTRAVLPPCPINPAMVQINPSDPLKAAADQLRDTLLREDFTGTILIPSGTNIDLGDKRSIPIKRCVTLKGSRNGLDPGPLLFTNNTKEGQVFQVIGDTVRIEGLRFQGPVPTYTDSQREANWEVTAIGIAEDLSQGRGINIVIDNNDFWFWTSAIAIGWERGPNDPPYPPVQMTKDQASYISVTRNYFHRNAREGAGYGVLVGSGYTRIEGNLFTHNRHAVAHGGYPLSGYIARYNYVHEGGFTEGVFKYWNQHFDVHGQAPGGYGGDAGGYFDISYNTIRGEQMYYAQTRPAFMLRGKPTIGAFFHDNVIVHNDATKAVRLKTSQTCDEYDNCLPSCVSNAACNLTVGQNAYNTDTSSDFAVGDFDGDGRDDIFLANGTAWWYSSAGFTEWRFLRASPHRIKDLRFGRFDADSRTDVLFAAGDWYVSSGGQGTPSRLRTGDARLTDCVFGDLNGDGITDALRANGTTWSIAYGAKGSWVPVRNSALMAANLRAGDFNGDKRDEIFTWATGWTLWSPATNIDSRDQRKPTGPVDMASLVVADFDGDGLADVAQTDGNGWRWIRSGSGIHTWMPLRGAGGQNQYNDIRLALFGRFTPRLSPADKSLDAIRYEMEPLRPPSRGFVIWKGPGTPDAFTLWTPSLQEMR
jgi:hypothetical protein